MSETITAREFEARMSSQDKTLDAIHALVKEQNGRVRKLEIAQAKAGAIAGAAAGIIAFVISAAINVGLAVLGK